MTDRTNPPAAATRTPRQLVVAAAHGDPAAIRALNRATAPLALRRAALLLSPELRPASAVELAIATLARQLPDPAHRLDLAHEATARVLALLSEPVSRDPVRTRWARLAEGEPVPPWIGGFVRFTVLKLLERDVKRLASESAERPGAAPGGDVLAALPCVTPDTEARVAAARDLRAVLAAIEKLPPRQREAIRKVIRAHETGETVSRDPRDHTNVHRARRALEVLVA